MKTVPSPGSSVAVQMLSTTDDAVSPMTLRSISQAHPSSMTILCRSLGEHVAPLAPLPAGVEHVSDAGPQ